MTTSDGNTRPSARPGLDRTARLAGAAALARAHVNGEPLPAHVLDALQSAIDAVNVALPAYQSEDEAKKNEQRAGAPSESVYAKAQAHYRAQITGLILQEQREARHAATHDRDGEGRP